jgi:hypothetical protein
MDSSHPTWGMGAVAVLGGIWEIIFLDREDGQAGMTARWITAW